MAEDLSTNDKPSLVWGEPPSSVKVCSARDSSSLGGGGFLGVLAALVVLEHQPQPT